MKRLLIITTNYPPNLSIGTQRILRICKYLDPSEWAVAVLTLKENYYPLPPGRAENGKLSYLDRVTVYRTHKFDLVFFLLNFRHAIRSRLKRGSVKQARPVFRLADSGDSEGAPRPEVAKWQGGWWQNLKDFITDIFQFPDKHVTWLPLAVLKGYRIIKKERVEVIFSSSPSHSLHLISTILKILTGKKLVVDFRDPWARSPWEAAERTLNAFERWKHRRIIGFERWVVSKADQVTLITRQMQQDFVRSYPDLPADKFKFFSNGYDPESVSPAAPGGDQPGAKAGKVTFIHAGSLYKFRDPTPILYAVKNLAERGEIEREKILFQFIGGVTADLAHVPPLAKELGIEDVVHFLPRVSYPKVMEMMAESQVLILLQPLTKLQLPGKFFDYLCLGKPIFAVAEKESATAAAVEEGFGVFADYNDVRDVEKGILFLYHHPQYNLDFIREHRQRFDMSKSIETFREILEL